MARLKFRRLTKITDQVFWIAMDPGTSSPVWIMWAGPGTPLKVSIGGMFVDMESSEVRGAYATLREAQDAVNRFQEGVVH